MKNIYFISILFLYCFLASEGLANEESVYQDAQNENLNDAKQGYQTMEDDDPTNMKHSFNRGVAE